METKAYNRVAVINMGSPQAVSQIDVALKENEKERTALLVMREAAVGLYGDANANVGFAEEAPNDDATIKEFRSPALPPVGAVAALVNEYRTHAESAYHKLRYRTRLHYDTLIKRIVEDCGSMQLADLKEPQIQSMYDGWIEDGKRSMGHALITMFRMMVYFGATVLEDPQCIRISVLLRTMRFAPPKPRTERLTEAHVKAIIKKAHELGRPSIALAQALQFQCDMGQKDVIGEWVPLNEPGVSDITDGKRKWLGGLRWEGLERDGMLTYNRSKDGRQVACNIKEAPLVIEELKKLAPVPDDGPMIVSEYDQLPWTTPEFRRWWRKVADAAGVPKDVRNSDSRERRSA